MRAHRSHSMGSLSASAGPNPGPGRAVVRSNTCSDPLSHASSFSATGKASSRSLVERLFFLNQLNILKSLARRSGGKDLTRANIPLVHVPIVRRQLVTLQMMRWRIHSSSPGRAFRLKCSGGRLLFRHTAYPIEVSLTIEHLGGFYFLKECSLHLLCKKLLHLHNRPLAFPLGTNSSVITTFIMEHILQSLSNSCPYCFTLARANVVRKWSTHSAMGKIGAH